MERTTLRAYLSKPNPNLPLDRNPQYKTSTIQRIDRDELEGKLEWEDFNLENILSLFRTVLDHPLNLPYHPTIFASQLRVRDERSFESVLMSYNCIIVNTALNAATELMGLPSITWLVGSYAEQIANHEKTFPDWAGISESNPDRNLVPGDSKFTRQAFDINLQRDRNEDSDVDSDISMDLPGSVLSDTVPSEPAPWTKVSDACIEQVNHYAKDWASRYCYLVSPYEVVVARRTMDQPMLDSISIAATRDPRTRNPRAPIPPPLSSSPTALSSSVATSSFSNSHPQTHMRPIELRSIKWSESGVDKLTFNLAIWSLHILAAIDQKVQTEYPELSEDTNYKRWEEGRMS